jgi:predicted amidohydrolase
MKMAAIQMVSTPRVADNLAWAERAVADAAAQGAQFVALPEYFCLMGSRDEDKLALAEPGVAVGERPEPSAAPLQAALSRMASQSGVWLVGGTVPLAAQQAHRVRNACCVFAPDGRLAARYDKVHLFCFDNGRERYDEARVLEAGEAPVAFEAAVAGEAWRVGLSVCYDLRFPELYRALMQPPCGLLVVPAAFTHTTGLAHWTLLLRARAVENQCYVLAIGQGGLHENGRRTFGHSMVIDPWGEVLAWVEEGPGLAMAEASLARLAEVRAQLPALMHRKW